MTIKFLIWSSIFANKKHRTIRNLIFSQLGRSVLLKDGKEFKDLPDNEQKIWKHYMDNFKLPFLKKVSITKQTQYIIDSIYPDEYDIFLDYSLDLELLDNQKKREVDNYYDYSYSFNYPYEFDLYTEKYLNQLFDKQRKLIIRKSKNIK